MNFQDYYHYNYFKNPSHPAEKCLFVSDSCGYVADPQFRIHRKTFYNYLAFYIRQGTFYLIQNGQKYTFHCGEGALISLFKPHLYYSDSNDTAHVLWFHFRGAGSAPLMEWLGNIGLLPYCYHDIKKEACFLELFQLTKEQAGDTVIASHLYRTIMEIISDHCFQAKEDESIPANLPSAVHFMKKNICINLSLQEISSEANMGKYHFSHMFKKYYGISPIQYFNSQKMEVACRLLTETNDNIEEIAEQIGYENVSYFRKVFKNYFGISPSVYRRLNL